MQSIEGTHVNYHWLVNSLKPGAEPLPANAWAWADSRNAETSKAEVRWAVFNSAINAPVLEVTNASAESVAYTPPNVTQLCRLAGYPKAAAPLVAAGADAATVREILLGDRRDHFMSAIASGTADAKYVLELAAAESSPVVLVAKQMAEAAKQHEGSN